MTKDLPAEPREIRDAARKIQSVITANPTSISQYAAIEALMGPQDDVERMRSEYKIRRDNLVEELNQIEGISSRKPAGTFYVFPKIDSLFKKEGAEIKIEDSKSFCSYILQEAHVALVPGKEFGCDNYVRLS